LALRHATKARRGRVALQVRYNGDNKDANTQLKRVGAHTYNESHCLILQLLRDLLVPCQNPVCPAREPSLTITSLLATYMFVPVPLYHLVDPSLYSAALSLRSTKLSWLA